MRRDPIRPPKPIPEPKEAPLQGREPIEPHRYHVTQAERKYRDAHPGPAHRLKPAYAHLLDLNTPGTGKVHARYMVREIQALIDRRHWTDSEAQMLHAARAKWARRAEGRDARYLFAGRQLGRLPAETQAAVKTYQTAIDIEDALRAAVADYKQRIPRSPAAVPEVPHAE